MLLVIYSTKGDFNNKHNRLKIMTLMLYKITYTDQYLLHQQGLDWLLSVLVLK